MENKKLTRPVNDVKIAGVCAGIAKYFDFDVTIVRILYAALTIFTVGFPGVLLYLLLMLIMPKEETSTIETPPSEVEKKD